jgi:hypothetical protein
LVRCLSTRPSVLLILFPRLGLGMFICTFIYMYTWVYTGEINAKRVRERYLTAVLRQDIQYFDKVGAGEVATRIQTDTRTSPCLSIFSPPQLIVSPRSCTARNFGKSGIGRQLSLCFRRWFRPSICEVLASRVGFVFDSALYRHHWRYHE